MTTQSRPLGFGDIDRNGSNQYPSVNILAASNGYPDEAVPMAKEWNTLGRQWSSWHRHLDQRALRSHLVSAGKYYRLSADAFAYAPAAGLTHAVVADSAYVIDGYVVDLPKTRLAAALLDPYTFQASRWHHFYVGPDGDTQVDVVTVGTAASPPVGYALLGTGKTDATDLVAFEGAPIGFAAPRLDLALKTYAPRLVVTDTDDEVAASVEGSGTVDAAVRAVNYAGGGGYDVDIGTSAASGYRIDILSGALGSTGFRATADTMSASTLFWAVQAGSGHTFAATSYGAGDSFSATHSGAGRALEVTHTGSGDAASISKSGLGRAMYLGHAGAGVGLDIAHSGSASAFTVSHTGNVAEVARISAVGTNAGALRVTGAGGGYGLYAEAGPTATAVIWAVPTSLVGQGFRSQTALGASASARAAYLEGRGSGVGAEVRAASNNALIVQGNTLYAAIKLTGQASRQLVNFGGEVGYAADEDQLVVGSSLDGAGRGVWTTAGGKVTADVAPANGFSSAVTTLGGAAWQPAATCSATDGDAPKRSGTIYLRFRCQPRNTVAVMSQNVLNVRLVDVTANPLAAIAGSTRAGAGNGDSAGFVLPALDTSWQGVVDLVFRVPVPAGGDRTWRAEVQTGGTADIRVRDCSLSVIAGMV